MTCGNVQVTIPLQISAFSSSGNNNPYFYMVVGANTVRKKYAIQ